MPDDASDHVMPPPGGRDGLLRRGWTTGACAAAATRAAHQALATGSFPDPVTIELPHGQQPSFHLAVKSLAAGEATAGVIKDAGDDPDVTHGALILATLRPGAAGTGVTFKAGAGVGTVTRPGLALAVGEPAINPAPRRIIARAIADSLALSGGPVDVEVTIAVPGGDKLAAKTLNARLGILGGLSILGTTGIVVPYSCSAWIHSIHRGIDVARAAGITHVAAATGSTSEAAVKAMYGLDDVALIDMGDFVGGTLKYLRNHPLPWLTLAGGFGKLSKLACGHLDLHSGRSAVDVGGLADLMDQCAAPAVLVARARGAVSAGEVLALADGAGVPLAAAVAAKARAAALAAVDGRFEIDVAVFGRGGQLIGHARA